MNKKEWRQRPLLHSLFSVGFNVPLTRLAALCKQHRGERPCRTANNPPLEVKSELDWRLRQGGATLVQMGEPIPWVRGGHLS